MRRLVIAALTLAAATLLMAGTAFAQAAPEFKMGFKALADQIPDVVGQPQENEHWGANGDSLQQTSKGLMVWRKADNWTAFTDGSRTWINGPEGVKDRANEERFPWEKEAVPLQEAAPVATPTPAPASSGPAAPSLPATLKVSIDKPAEGIRVGYSLKVTGWAVSTDAAGRPWSGIEEFKAFLDGVEGTGKALSVKVTRVSRPDVGSSLGNPAFANSGFSLEFTPSEIPEGRHTLYLYLRSVTTGWWWKPIAFTFGYQGDWNLYDRAADGFRLSLPPGWAPVDLLDTDLAGQFRRAYRDNPEVAAKAGTLAFVGTILQLLGGQLIAFPPAEGVLPDPLATSVKLLVPPIDTPQNLDKTAQLLADQLNKEVAAGMVRSPSQRRVSLPAGDAVEFTYLQVATSSGVQMNLAVLDYAILHDGAVYELVFSCPAERFDQYRPLFDAIARSLQFTDGAAPGTRLSSLGEGTAHVG